MPRIVDHSSRRRALGAAACTVLDRDGYRGLSVRAVAREARMPLGTAQHYAPTRDAMVRAAIECLTERIVERARRIPHQTITLETVRAGLHQLLPLDPCRVFEARVWLALSAAAATEPSIIEALATAEGEQHSNLVRLIDHAKGVGDVAAEVEAAQTAHILTSVINGLTIRMLTTRLPDDAAVSELDSTLTALLGGSEVRSPHCEPGRSSQGRT